MEATRGVETLATLLNQAEDRLYSTFERLPEEMRPDAVWRVIEDKEKIEEEYAKEYAKADSGMARAGQDDIKEYLQEADAFISKYK